MTKIFLPTELGVKGEGSNSGIEDKHTPDVKEIDPLEDPAVKEQPDFYKRIRDSEKNDTLAEVYAGKDNTRNQADFDKSPKEGKPDPAREPVEGVLNEGAEAASTTTKTSTTKKDTSK